jgi:hypothetical protein
MNGNPTCLQLLENVESPAVRCQIPRKATREPAEAHQSKIPRCRLRLTRQALRPSKGSILAFIYAYTHVLGRTPAEVDLQRHFGVSPPSVHQMVLTLERTGLIRRKPGVARSIEVLVAPDPTLTRSRLLN